MKNRRNRLLSNGLFYIIVFVILLAGINWAVGGSGSNGSTENIRYSQLVKDLKAGKVKSINVQPSNGVYTVTGSYKKAQKSNNQNNNGFGLIPSSQSSNEPGSVLRCFKMTQWLRQFPILPKRVGHLFLDKVNLNLEPGSLRL